MRQVEWLGATSIHSKDQWFGRTLLSIAALVDNYPQLGVVVNLFDAKRVNAPGLVGRFAPPSQVEGTWVPGMKTLFWKRVLTPQRTHRLRAVWLFDCDIAVHPSAFPLGQLVGVLRATRASLMQPSVRALVHGTYHTWLRVRNAHMSCQATTAQFVEMQTPLFTGETWAKYNAKARAPGDGQPAPGCPPPPPVRLFFTPQRCTAAHVVFRSTASSASRS